MKLRLLRSSDPVAAPSPSDLMVQAGRGDQQAFALVYDELAPIVYGVVLRVVRNPAIAEEIAQEAFVEMWRVASRFDAERGSVHGWASTIAHRKAVDRVRSEQSRTDREDRDHVDGNDTPTDHVVEVIERSESRAEVRAALDNLSDPQREAITLAYFGGKTYREVAAMLDVPEGTIKTRIRDGLIRLRRELEGSQ